MPPTPAPPPEDAAGDLRGDLPEDLPENPREDPREVYATLDVGLRVGELLLASGAGAADVRAQMDNVVRACGLRHTQAEITFTRLSMSHQPAPDLPALLQERVVQYRGVDYAALTTVDHLVRDLIDGRIDRDQVRRRLNLITSTAHRRPRWSVAVGWGVMGAAVAAMLRGSWLVMAVAFVAAVVIDQLQRAMARRRWPVFYQQVAGGLVATLLAVGVAASGADDEVSQVISAAVLLLLTGVSFLGAIQDALTGYPITAGARILEAVLATAGLIAGVSGGLQVASVAGVNLGRVDPGSVSFAVVPVAAVGGGVAAAAYAWSTWTPARALAPILAIGLVATAAYVSLLRAGFGIVWASAVGALLVGLVSYAVAGRARVPALVVVVAGLTPMLPGLSIYRGLSLLTDDGAQGLISLVNAGGIAVALAAGAILGEYLAQPLKREARRVERRLAGPRLVGPFTAHPSRRRR